MHAYDDIVIVPALQRQAGLPAEISSVSFDAPDIDLSIYDFIVVCMSGGKDSIACVTRLIDMGADMNRVELWHHDIDGREGSTLMDWSFMADYNRKLAKALGLPLYFSWLDGGFEGEMLKENSLGRPHKIETPDGLMVLERDAKRGKPGTRLKFPQTGANLQTRWCSSALKIDVGRRALNNQDRFNNSNVLFITGERREESTNRAHYNQLEPHACDRRNGRKTRRVDAWRPVLHWKEDQVWDTLERHRIIPPVPYRLGWSRSSCMACIYNGPQIWATINEKFSERIAPITAYETRFGTTISRSRRTVAEIATASNPLEIIDIEALDQARRREYLLPVLLRENQTWKLPAGAFRREGCGAT